METKVKCHGNPIQELLSPWHLVLGDKAATGPNFTVHFSLACKARKIVWLAPHFCLIGLEPLGESERYLPRDLVCAQSIRVKLAAERERRTQQDGNGRATGKPLAASALPNGYKAPIID